jgi:MOSC domain-containing protein YiiM
MMSMKGRIISVCISAKKGTKKREVDSARLVSNWGIEGDAHSGDGHRQVSFLSIEEIEKVKKIIPDLKPGDFAENIITQGIDPSQINIGDQIVIEDNILLEVTQIGKECHTGCQIQTLTGKCIMPEKGIFARSLKGGLLEKNNIIRIERCRN